MLQRVEAKHNCDELSKVLRLKTYGNSNVPEKDFEDFLNSQYFLQSDLQQKQESYDAMLEVTQRIRGQVRSIVRSLRHWQDNHAEFQNNTRLRYSAYEGALCYSDLRRHWAYYRHAMRELQGHG